MARAASRTPKVRKSRTRRGVTILDVAKKAGVCLATASRAFGHTQVTYIAPETKERVLAAARSLSYQPQAAARSLALGKSHTLAMMIGMPDTLDLIPQPTLADQLLAMGQEAHRHGYQVMPLVIPPETANYDDWLISLYRQNVFDAVLLSAGASNRKKFLNTLLGLGCAVVIRGYCTPQPGLAAVHLDPSPIHDRIFEFVNQRQYYPCWFMTMTPEGRAATNTPDFHGEGVKRAMHRYGLKEGQVRLVEYDYDFGTVPALVEHLQKMFARHGRPRLLVCEDEYTAWGLTIELEKVGIHVPRDLLLAAGSDVRSFFCPFPVMIRAQPVGRHLGETVVRLMIKLLSGKTPLGESASILSDVFIDEIPSDVYTGMRPLYMKSHAWPTQEQLHARFGGSLVRG